MNILLEVCISSVADAIAAAEEGANRLELNQALELGGLTPTVELLAQVKRAVELPVIAMIRPRAAGFHYSSDERELMLADADRLLAAGADGIAAGALRDDGVVDIDLWAQLVALARDRQVVFHRAFDVVNRQFDALEQLIGLGTTRVLTSGAKWTALEGAARIAELVAQAAGRIEILPASGIAAENVAYLVQKTGCRQVHGSFGQVQSDNANPVAASDYPITSRERVRAVRSILDSLK